MISRVWGRCDNSAITFTRGAGDVWTAQVPYSFGMTFYVEVYAEDTAGNQSYVATILITKDSTSLDAKIEITKIGNAILLREIFGKPTTGNEICGSVSFAETESEASLAHNVQNEVLGGQK